MIGEEELSYPSADGKTTIQALLWLPEGAVRGVVQLVHGMAEHKERYEPFARFLNGCGFAVCINDHVGHGQSVASKADWGHLPLEGGAAVLVEDVHALRGLMQERFGVDTPYVLFGHSMGSFVVRSYLACHGAGLSGAIISGTGNQAVALSRVGNLLARIMAGVNGDRYCSTLLDNMGAGSYSKAIADARTPFDWLNTDPDQVDIYIADEACGFMFDVGGYASLTDLTAQVAKPACAAAVPDGLPILFISGEEDPVGGCGKGVREAAALLTQNSSAQVTVILYPGMRHEILNEPGHQTVYHDVSEWLDGVLPR